MTVVASIVEGDGEVAALPVLLRRIGQWLTPEKIPQVVPPIRIPRDRFLNRPEEFNRYLQLAAAKSGDSGWILILLDADDDCPAALGLNIADRARAVVPHRRVAVVLANREFEAWFIAAASSLDGVRNFALRPGDEAVNPELPRNAKGWMGDRIVGGGYRETTDQPAFAARFDLSVCMERSRSFRKLCSEWKKNFDG